MPETLDDELIHLTCARCGKITSLSYLSLKDVRAPLCPYCGEPLPIDQVHAHDDALRKAQELDAAPDALGSHE